RLREHVRDEDTLIDLEPSLLLLRELALVVDRLTSRYEARIALRGGVDEVADAKVQAKPVGELVVDRIDVLVEMLVSSRPQIGGHEPPTRDSAPGQYGSRSSRF